jgi:hypothetical protein
MPLDIPFGFGRGGGPGMMGHNGGPAMPFTYDGYTRDSTGVFYVGELERLDQTIHEPLYSVTWGRDIDIRDDITTGDEISSFTNSSFAAAGGINPSGIAWIGKDVNAITGAQLDIGKTPQPLFLWGMELSYTMPELASAMQAGRPIDTQKYDVIRTKHQMDIDQLVYTGDPVVGSYGLLNHPAVTNVSNVTGGTWAAAITAATPDIMLAQVNELLASVWAASGWAVMPTELRVPPQQFGQLVANKVSTAGNVSVLRFLQENSLSNSQNGRPLNIQPLKWLVNRGAANSQRMLAYTKEKNRVRYPMTPLQRTPLEWRSLYNITTYWGRLGMIEVVYPETLGYRDGI